MKIVIHRLTYHEDKEKYYVFTTEYEKLEKLLLLWKENGKDITHDRVDTFTFSADQTEVFAQFINKAIARYDSGRGRNPWFEEVGLY
jgi:hypothetical protein